MRHSAVTAPRSVRLAMIATRIGNPARRAAVSSPPERNLLLHRQSRVRADEQILIDEHVAAGIAVRARLRGKQRQNHSEQSDARGAVQPKASE